MKTSATKIYLCMSGYNKQECDFHESKVLENPRDNCNITCDCCENCIELCVDYDDYIESQCRCIYLYGKECTNQEAIGAINE